MQRKKGTGMNIQEFTSELSKFRNNIELIGQMPIKDYVDLMNEITGTPGFMMVSVDSPLLKIPSIAGIQIVISSRVQNLEFSIKEKE